MLPELFLKRMQNMLGEEYGEFVESLEGERYQSLRLNRLKLNINGQRASEMDFNEFMRLTPVEWAEDGYYYGGEDKPGRHPYHEAGVYYIQEPSAMFPVSMLLVEPGEIVLDLCAAPGGKSTQIAAQLGGEGLLVCNEINPQRAKILSENIERMGVCNAFVTNEAPERISAFFPEYFDKILVDAPCSGEGMFRKNEAACDEWSPQNVRMCAARQDAILDEAAKMLRPGGRMVYSTCTFAEEEDEGSVERFIQRHPEFEVLKMQRLWPHKIKGEGHFAAVLTKQGSESMEFYNFPANGLEMGISGKELGDCTNFILETFSKEPQTEIAEKLLMSAKNDRRIRFSKFGDNIYLIPDTMPFAKGLRVLRTGLHVGIIKKNRFEPAHALAMAISPGDVKNICNLDSSDERVLQYLNGRTFSLDKDKGWYLVCVDGFGMGWGKLTGGIMKNHYPKGLRINI